MSTTTQTNSAASSPTEVPANQNPNDKVSWQRAYGNASFYANDDHDIVVHFLSQRRTNIAKLHQINGQLDASCEKGDGRWKALSRERNTLRKENKRIQLQMEHMMDPDRAFLMEEVPGYDDWETAEDSAQQKFREFRDIRVRQYEFDTAGLEVQEGQGSLSSGQSISKKFKAKREKIDRERAEMKQRLNVLATHEADAEYLKASQAMLKAKRTVQQIVVNMYKALINKRRFPTMDERRAAGTKMMFAEAEEDLRKTGSKLAKATELVNRALSAEQKEKGLKRAAAMNAKLDKRLQDIEREERSSAEGVLAPNQTKQNTTGSRKRPAADDLGTKDAKKVKSAATGSTVPASLVNAQASVATRKAEIDRGSNENAPTPATHPPVSMPAKQNPGPIVQPASKSSVTQAIEQSNERTVMKSVSMQTQADSKPAEAGRKRGRPVEFDDGDEATIAFEEPVLKKQMTNKSITAATAATTPSKPDIHEPASPQPAAADVAVPKPAAKSPTTKKPSARRKKQVEVEQEISSDEEWVGPLELPDFCEPESSSDEYWQPDLRPLKK